MDGGVDGVELVLSEVARIGEGGLAAGADEREGGVEDDGGLRGVVDILVGIADGDGTHSRGGAASHGDDRDGDIEQQAHEGAYRFSAQRLIRHLDGTIEHDEEEDKEDEGKKEVPMAQHLDEEDVAEVTLVGEFREEGPGGAAACVAGIDGVDEVDAQHKGVDDNEEPLL